MFELLCIISMALCKVLVLVNVGIVSFFPFCTELTEGGLSSHVSRQIFLVLYRHCLRTHTQKKKEKKKKKPRSSPSYEEVFFLKSSAFKRYFNRRSTKQQQWQVHPGDTFQPQGLTPTPPDPPDKQHFLSQALFALVWSVFFLLHT